jgi:hypothetical protein
VDHGEQIEQTEYEKGADKGRRVGAGGSDIGGLGIGCGGLWQFDVNERRDTHYGLRL